MKAIVNTSKGTLRMEEVPIPEPGKGEVRIKTSFCGICASDFEMIDGWDRGKYPQILGHEWSGTVDKLGPGVDTSLSGVNCVAENVVADGGEVGFEHPGGYGEYFITQADKIISLPTGVSLEIGALIEPLAVGVRGVNKLSPVQGPAIVIGDGTIGLLLLLKFKGVEDVTLVGGREGRLNLAMELGASRIFNYHRADGPVPEYIASQNLHPFATIVEAATSSDATRLASLTAKNEAKILLIGNYVDKHTEIDLLEFLHKEFQLIGSNASAGAWEEAVEIAATGKLPLEKIISEVFQAEDYENAMAAARNSRNSVKTLIKWG